MALTWLHDKLLLRRLLARRRISWCYCLAAEAWRLGLLVLALRLVATEAITCDVEATFAVLAGGNDARLQVLLMTIMPVR